MDEIVICIKDRDDFKEAIRDIIKSSIGEVSREYMLRKDLDCDVDFGEKYSDIH